MPRYHICGADRTTGIDCSTTIEAYTERDAVKQAGATMLIESVKAVPAPAIVYATPIPTNWVPPGSAMETVGTAVAAFADAPRSIIERTKPWTRGKALIFLSVVATVALTIAAFVAWGGSRKLRYNEVIARFGQFLMTTEAQVDGGALVTGRDPGGRAVLVISRRADDSVRHAAIIVDRTPQLMKLLSGATRKELVDRDAAVSAGMLQTFLEDVAPDSSPYRFLLFAASRSENDAQITTDSGRVVTFERPDDLGVIKVSVYVPE